MGEERESHIRVRDASADATFADNMWIGKISRGNVNVYIGATLEAVREAEIKGRVGQGSTPGERINRLNMTLFDMGDDWRPETK